MKVEKLMSKNQSNNWYDYITRECLREYPINLVNIASNDVVIDAGCNVGGFTNAFKHKFENILGIDASIYNVEEYKKHHKNTVLHKAIYHKDNEIVKLKKYICGEDDTNSGNFSITGFVYKHNNHGWGGDEYEEVETISIESIINLVGDIGLLKIDIEGAEYDALYNKDLSRINYITGEFHNFLGNQKHKELFDWIEKTHQEIYTVGDGSESHFTKLYKRRI